MLTSSFTLQTSLLSLLDRENMSGTCMGIEFDIVIFIRPSIVTIIEQIMKFIGLTGFES
jgi:hypothetical protein